LPHKAEINTELTNGKYEMRFGERMEKGKKGRENCIHKSV
jgi:hypothetical protein